MSVENLSDAQLRSELQSLGFTAPPVTQTSRKLLEKKLTTLRKARGSAAPSAPTPPSTRKSASPRRVNAARPPVVNESGDNSSFMELPQRRSSSKSRKPAARKSLSDDDVSEEIAAPPPKPSPSRMPRPQPTPPTSRSSKPTPTPRYQKPTPSPPRSAPKPVQRTTQSSYFQSTESDAEDKPESYVDSFKRRTADFGSDISPSSYKAKLTPLGFKRHLSERGPYGTPGGRFSPVTQHSLPSVQSQKTANVPKWIMAAFVLFTIFLFVVYVITVHPKECGRVARLFGNAMSDTVSFWYSFFVLPVLFAIFVGAAAFAAFFIYKRRRIAAAEFKRKSMDLVDRIADRVRGAGSHGIAEQRIRDELLPPTRRTASELALWNDAAEFINTTDSRIRSDSRLVNGIECNVWIWINTFPENKAESITDRALTRCLKLRADAAMIKSGTKADIQRDIYQKMSPIVPVHIDIRSGSFGDHDSETLIYMMFDTLEQAKAVFDKFHSHIFRNNLVTAKYVRDERYCERFPELKGR